MNKNIILFKRYNKQNYLSSNFTIFKSIQSDYSQYLVTKHIYKKKYIFNKNCDLSPFVNE